MSKNSRTIWILPAMLLAIASAKPARAAGPNFADFDRQAKAGERLNVVFFGASLTWGANATDPQLTSYRGQLAQRLEKEYPKAHFKFWDGAIGGTGSQLGLFRLDREVLRHKPDLVFVDFSANDSIGTATPETLASYEAIIRRIILEAKVPVVQVIFPFQWDVAKGTTEGMLRRDAHLAISKAYHTTVGDAIDRAITQVKSGKIAISDIWPVDGVHPGDKGYELFTDAAWEAFEQGVHENITCIAPEKMVNAPTYMTSARVRISTLGSLPAGWVVGAPHVVSAYFDMLMSRWLDDEVIVTNKPLGKDGKPAATQPLGRLRVKFNGSMVMLFGESTPKSGNYHVIIDGKAVPWVSGDGKQTRPEFDAGSLGKVVNGNCHLSQVLAEGLDPKVEHTLEIEPAFTGDAEQEIRLESICVAGEGAAVGPMP